MPVGDDTFAYRGRLPHLAKPERIYDVTFCTTQREVLTPAARDIVLRTCVAFHEVLCWLDCIIVMPDHVHVILIPYLDSSLSRVLGRMKGRSSFEVNRRFGRQGPLWQRESFDRMIRSEDKLAQKRAYIFDNPVRAGLVSRWQDYPWIWWSGGL